MKEVGIQRHAGPAAESRGVEGQVRDIDSRAIRRRGAPMFDRLTGLENETDLAWIGA